ncbi:MAG: glycosyltransferase family 52 protein [Lachnospiraceae bacterium]|nr:glycosyltransferase family 52 protein [Lachnospiraceae bacterium]
MKSGRIYVCHTFYHVYISFLKEFARPESDKGNASIVLSKLSNDFGDIGDRIPASGYFKEVFVFDEKRDTEFPELAKYRKNRGNIVLNMIPRIIFTSKFAKLQEKYVPVDFKNYEEIYVFCDNDPIGIYLNKKRIHYHAVEDGLNYLASFVNAHADNKGHFGIKKFMSMKLNLIFMQDGYSKYCLDMEVNDLSLIRDDFCKYKEVPRAGLEAAVTEEQKEVLVRVFVKKIDDLNKSIANTKNSGKNILILTEPLCTLDVRERIFRDLYDRFSPEGTVFFKIHPRDELDYDTLFPDVFKFDKKVPMEILNFFPSLHFDKIVSVFTQLGSIKFADEKVYLGVKFMDNYEDKSVHANIVE